MKKNVIGKCPICQKDLIVTKLTCQHCQTDLVGEFELSKFDCLTPSQLAFVLVFFKNQGNIRMIEADLGISYPTVKKNIEEVMSALGFAALDEKKTSRANILERLQKGEISFDEAEKMLEKL